MSATGYRTIGFLQTGRNCNIGIRGFSVWDKVGTEPGTSASGANIANFVCLWKTQALADLRGGGAPGTPPRSNFFHFHAVFEKKIGQIIGWRPHVWESWIHCQVTVSRL